MEKINKNGVMPLLITFTPTMPIEEEVELHNIIYDETSQIVYDMRIVGTKCLRTHTTKKTRGRSYSLVTDRKNEIDDQKSVK
ncbi:MAG: hypothetical protein IKV32_00250 [Muribaculaceae bacterium]|nr:hypothetical protein [Muribaculaceae bacterium]